MRHPYLRLRASLYRVRWILAFLAVWLIAALLAYRSLGRLDWTDALLSALYFEVQPGIYSQAYAFWGQSILFGVVGAVLVRETMENHAERCRTMAGYVKDHTIIVGYTHVGKRLVEHCIKHRLPYVLLEKRAEAVDDLLRAGEPVIVDDARSKDALPAANIKEAKRLIIASDNIETALIVTKVAHDLNPSCVIASRCAIDELVGVLEKLGAQHVYSTSMAAFQELAKLVS